MYKSRLSERLENKKKKKKEEEICFLNDHQSDHRIVNTLEYIEESFGAKIVPF